MTDLKDLIIEGLLSLGATCVAEDQYLLIYEFEITTSTQLITLKTISVENKHEILNKITGKISLHRNLNTYFDFFESLKEFTIERVIQD